MKRLLIMIASLSIASIAHAGYPAGQFISLHQPAGFKNTCLPGVSTCRTNYVSGSQLVKLFVPPGANSVNLTTYVGQSAGSAYGVIARAGRPPDATQLPDVNILPNNGFSMAELNKSDCMGRNSSGYLRIINDYAKVTTGVWVYAQIFVIKGNLSNTTSTVRADQIAFNPWYYGVKWQSNGDPPEGTVTPTPTPKPTPTPTPTPTPKPTPTPECVIDIPIVPGELYRFVVVPK